MQLSNRQKLWGIFAIAVFCNGISVGVFMLYALSGRGEEALTVHTLKQYIPSLRAKTQSIYTHAKRFPNSSTY